MASLLRCLVVPPDAGSCCPGRYCAAGQRCLCLGWRLLSRCSLSLFPCCLSLILSFSLPPLPASLLLPPPIFFSFFDLLRCACLFKYLCNFSFRPSRPSRHVECPSAGMERCSRGAPASGFWLQLFFSYSLSLQNHPCVDGRIQIICFEDFSNIF